MNTWDVIIEQAVHYGNYSAFILVAAVVQILLMVRRGRRGA